MVGWLCGCRRCAAVRAAICGGEMIGSQLGGTAARAASVGGWLHALENPIDRHCRGSVMSGHADSEVAQGPPSF